MTDITEKLIEIACDAQDAFDLDELEQFANEQRKQKEPLRERWVFTNEELLNPQNTKRDDQFLALPNYDLIQEKSYKQLFSLKNMNYVQDQTGIVVDRKGRPLNLWEDGTVGVPKEVKDATDEVESYITLNAENIAEHWRNVITNQEGHFLNWDN